jgi:hypothetical protein
VRTIEIEVQPGEVLRASLLGDAAPKTAEAVWQALPIQAELRHASYSGYSLYIFVDFRVGEPENLLAEDVPSGALVINTQQSSYMVKGEIIPEEIMFVYGPCRFFNFTGWFPCNHFAQLEPGDLERLAAIGQRIIDNGTETVTIRRDE